MRSSTVALLTLTLLGIAGSSVCAQEPAPSPTSKETKPAQAQPAPATAAQPAAPAAPAPGAVTITGLIDGYYQINFQHPKALPTLAGPAMGLHGSTTGGINATRAFDYRDNFGLSLGEISLTRTAGKGFPLGVTATVTVGDTPGVVEATEPGGRTGYEAIQQLYVTYSPHVFGRDITLDFGKFVSPFGNEVIESVNDDNVLARAGIHLRRAILPHGRPDRRASLKGADIHSNTYWNQ